MRLTGMHIVIDYDNGFRMGRIVDEIDGVSYLAEIDPARGSRNTIKQLELFAHAEISEMGKYGKRFCMFRDRADLDKWVEFAYENIPELNGDNVVTLRRREEG